MNKIRRRDNLHCWCCVDIKADVLRMELTFSQKPCKTTSLATLINKTKQDELLRYCELKV